MRWGATIETGAAYVRRWCVGETGGGKSRLLHLWWEQWLRDAPDGEVIVLDLEERLPPPSRGVRVVPDVRPDVSSHGPHYEFVNAWAWHFYERNRDDGRPRLLVIDETDLAIRHHEAPPALVTVVARGRKEGLSWAFGTRRWTEIPPLLREQAQELAVFNLDDPGALRVAANMGLDPQQLRTLRVGEFVHRVRGKHAPHLHRGALSACT